MKGENRRNVANMIQRLYRLEANISAMPPAASSTLQNRNDELVRHVSLSMMFRYALNVRCTPRKLNEMSSRLKGMSVKSIIRSGDIKAAILDCISDIDAQERDYTVSRPFRR